MNKEANGSAEEVRRFEVDWEDLAWCVLRNAGLGDYSPGPDVLCEDGLKHMLKSGCYENCSIFMNPRFTVWSSDSSDQFFTNATKAEGDWLHEAMDALFHSSRSWKRLLKKQTPLIRQLCFTGVMIIDGKHTRPDLWPRHHSKTALRKRRKDLSGRCFGRLRVIKPKGPGQWECLCECKQVAVVKTCHLRSGKTQSCGCLKKEIDTRRRTQKERRIELWRS